jgi:hypothetical protein
MLEYVILRLREETAWSSCILLPHHDIVLGRLNYSVSSLFTASRHI